MLDEISFEARRGRRHTETANSFIAVGPNDCNISDISIGDPHL